MRMLVHDYSGHPFQAQLSRELARRGHDVTHSYCDAHQSGKGRLDAAEDETVRFAPIACGDRLEKHRFLLRLFKELGYGRQLAVQIRQVKPDAVVIGNAPIPTMAVAALSLFVRRIPWVLWQQDIQAMAAKSFAGRGIRNVSNTVASCMEYLERWCARRASTVVVIAEAFRDVHVGWRTASKVHVVPNWAPL